MAVDVRLLGQSAFQLSGGGADVLVDPFLTGNPKAAATADEVAAGRDPAHPRPRRPPRRHRRHRQAHRRDGAWRSSSSRPRSQGDGVEDVVDPNFGGTVDVRLGLGQARPRLAHRGLARAARRTCPPAC